MLVPSRQHVLGKWLGWSCSLTFVSNSCLLDTPGVQLRLLLEIIANPLREHQPNQEPIGSIAETSGEVSPMYVANSGGTQLVDPDRVILDMLV